MLAWLWRRAKAWRSEPTLLRFAGGTVWSVAGSAAGRAVNLGAVLVVAASLGPNSFGIFALVQALISFVAIVGTFGLGLAATKMVAQSRRTDVERAGATAISTLVLALLFGIAGTVAVLAISSRSVLGFLGPADIAGGLRAAFGIPLCAGVIGVQVGVLSGLERFRDVSLIVVVRAVCDGVLMVVGSSRGVNGALFGLSCGELVATVVGQVVLARAMRVSGIPFSGLGVGIGGSLWGIAVPSLAANLSISLATVAAQVTLVKLGGGYGALGVFSLAFRWYLVAAFLSGAITPVALSMLAHENATTVIGARFVKVLNLSLWAHLVLTLVPAILIASAAPLLASFGGDDYKSATPVIIWLAIASIPTALNNLLSQTAISLNLIREWLASDIALGLTIVSVTAVLAMSAGPVALAVGYLAGMLMTCAVLAWPVVRKLQRSSELVVVDN